MSEAWKNFKRADNQRITGTQSFIDYNVGDGWALIDDCPSLDELEELVQIMRAYKKE